MCEVKNKEGADYIKIKLFFALFWSNVILFILTWLCMLSFSKLLYGNAIPGYIGSMISFVILIFLNNSRMKKVIKTIRVGKTE